MELKQTPSGLLVTLEEPFDLAVTLTCGQCFRFKEISPGVFSGVGRDLPLTLRQPDSCSLLLENTDPRTFESHWADYFDLRRDYRSLRQRMSLHPATAAAAAFCPGLHLLRQDPWEALATFILSQNNNIPRITGIVERLCACFGQPLGGDAFTFPTAQRLAALTVEELAPLRAGFRAKYLLDAARRVAEGSLDLALVGGLDTPSAARLLCTVHGVGPKVARCALLYGFGHDDALPVDVWIDRALRQFFPQGFPCELEDCAGVVQQFLFEYVRHCPDALT